MDSTEFDNVPLLERETNNPSETVITRDTHQDQQAPRKRSVRFKNPTTSDTITIEELAKRKDPFDITDEEFEKLSLYRLKFSSAHFLSSAVIQLIRRTDE